MKSVNGKYYIANRNCTMEWIETSATTERGAKTIASKAYGAGAQIGQDFGLCGIEETHWRGIDGEWMER